MSSDGHQALLRAIEVAGSQSKLAAICGCTTPNIWQHVRKKRPLPAEFVLKVEAATAIPRWELRPDIYPMDLPAGPAAHAASA